MATGQKILKGFHDQPLYSSSLSHAHPKDVKVIKEYTDSMFGELFEMIDGLKREMENSPELREQLVRVLRGEEILVNGEPVISGSAR